MSETVSLAHAKGHLSELVDRVQRSHERISITRHGRRDAVLVCADDIDALEETLELLCNQEAMHDIAQAREELARGEGLDAEALRARYLNADA